VLAGIDPQPLSDASAAASLTSSFTLAAICSFSSSGMFSHPS